MVSERLEKIIENMDELYQFILISMDNMKRPQDYGTGELLNMVEMHTLGLIADQPGICVSDVARVWGRTLGAASRNVNRLAQKGYVKKEKLPGNDKNVHLYATEKGQAFAQLHKQHDRETIEADAQEILKHHTIDEVETFFSVLHSLKVIFETK